MTQFRKTRSQFKAIFLILPFLLLQVTTAIGQVNIVIDPATNDYLPYSQDFNSSLATKNNADVTWKNGTTNTSTSTINGWYLGMEGVSIPSFNIKGNDNTILTPGAFSYGAHDNPERSIGLRGMANIPGVFYAALRMKNNSGKVITDFKIDYAIEQWYFSGEVTQVDLEYAIGPNVISATTTSVSWYPVDKISTPVSSGIARSTDGNLAENRVIKTFELKDINLPIGQEIVFRWALKITSNRTKFNGVALDDVKIKPNGVTLEAPVYTAITYYNKVDKPLDDTRSWGTNQDGSGTNPRNFTDPKQTFVIKNMPAPKTKGDPKKHREDGYTLSIKSKDGWLVSGEESKVVLGDGTNPLKMAIHHKKFYTGQLELKANTTLVINTDKKLKSLPTFVNLDPTSTVVYSDSTDIEIQNVPYGNLVILGNEFSKTHNIVNDLSAPLTLTGKLELSSKKINLKGKPLTISGNGSITATDANSYLIASDMGSTLNQLVGTDTETLFPVGTASSYLPVKIKSAGKAVTYNVAVKDGVANANTNIGTSQAVVVANTTWVLEKETVTGATASSIVLQWKDALTEAATYTSAMLYVGKYNELAKNWELSKVESYQKNALTGLNEITFSENFANPATSATGNNTLTANLSRTSNMTMATPAAATQRGEYAIFREILPMPVELVSFTAARSPQSTNLAWKTALEKDNSHFEVEFSLDSKTFTKAGEVKGQGNSSVANYYKFNHQTNQAGTLYYRLKQVDFDGKAAYSKVVTVEATSTQQQALTVAPNPTAGELTLYLPAPDTYTLTVLNMEGSVIKNELVTAGQQQVSIDLDAQPAGAYILQLQSGNNITTNKILKY